MNRFLAVKFATEKGRSLGVLMLCLLLLTAGCVSLNRKKTPQYFPGQTRTFLPAEELNAGWGRKIIGHYRPESLYQYIDGEAELYLTYGFQELTAAEYFSDGAEERIITVEVYRMDSKLNAFGIYSSYRQTDSELVSVGVEGFIGDFALLFYQNEYFARILISGEAESNHKQMLDFGRMMEERLPHDLDPPQELELITLDCALPGSMRYFARGFLGYSFFTNVLEVECLVEAEPVRAFLVICGDQKEAAAVLRAYRGMLGQISSVGENRFSGIDPYHGEVLVETKDRFLAGVIGKAEESKRNAILDKLLAGLKR